MLRSSATTASRMLRLVAASSQQSVLCHRAIATSPDSLKHKLAFALFNPSLPRFPSPADQCRGYARGRPVISEDEDEDEDEDDDDDDEEFEDVFDSDEEITDGDDACFNEAEEADRDDDDDSRKN